MKRYNRNIAQKNMLMSAELIKVMKLLKENNIEAIAFKGPTLAQMAYGDIALRQYADLDILIDEKDIEQCYNLILKTHTTTIDKKFLRNTLFTEKNSDIQYFNKKNNILIEIHWKLFRTQFSNYNQFSNIFNTKKEVLLQGHKLHVFNDEILLVYLCMHGSKHCWERISWILDISMIINNNKTLDWNFIKDQALKLECETMLYLGLELCHKLFNTKIPIPYKQNTNLINYVLKSFIYLLQKQTEVNKNLNTFKFHFALNDTTYQKVKFLIKTIFPINAQDVSEINLPKSFYFLYYIIKPFRLIIKYISKLFQ